MSYRVCRYGRFGFKVEFRIGVFFFLGEGGGREEERCFVKEVLKMDDVF